MEGFSTQIERASILKIEIEDVDRMKKYQHELINLLLYEQPKSLAGNPKPLKIQAIHDEISACEKWLKNYTKEIVNDKNRKLIN